MRFVCIDTETTGLNPSKGSRLIEIGAVEIVDDQLKEDFQYLIDPGINIPYYITNINGITTSMIRKNGMPARIVLKNLKEFIGDSILIFQNAGFDLTFLNFELELYNMQKIRNPFIDTIDMSREIYKNERKHNLDIICNRLCIEIESRHRALGDARATAQAFIKMKKELKNFPQKFLKYKEY
jgi:DNA polymerase-3 subunit epsilon